MSPEFEKKMVDLLPKMRIWAWYLTRDHAAADDLVQDAAIKVMLACESFTPGSNFSPWVYRIVKNQFINGIRQKRPLTAALGAMPQFSVAAVQQNRTDVRELGLAFLSLRKTHRDAFRSIVLQERSYEEVATTTGLAIGTVKSRVYRARLQLRAHMEHETQRLAA